MSNSLEQLKTLELKANFTPRERKYFDKLRDELEAIVGGVSIEELTKPSDAAQAGRIRAKLEEMLKFVKYREMEAEVWDRERFMKWVEEFNLQDELTDHCIDENLEFRDEGIICKGSLNLRDTSISYLPDNLQTQGSLILVGCTGLTSLPDNLQVKGSLYLEHCTGLTSLPDNLQVQGGLYLKGCTGITSLPDNLQVPSYLDLEGCTRLTSLPDNLKVTRTLFLNGCTGLTSLPDGIIVQLDVYVKGCPRKIIKQACKLKARGQISGQIKGDIRYY